MERSSITAEYAPARILFREDNARLKSILSSTRDTKNIKDREIESRESKSNPCFRHPFPAHDSAKSGGSDLIRPVSRSKRHGNISARGRGIRGEIGGGERSLVSTPGYLEPD